MQKNSISLQYLAGFIDGEGCFNFGRTRKSMFARILVTNTNAEILLKLKNAFGGDVTFTTVKNKPNWKPRGVWRLSWNKAIVLAEQLHEFLQIKKPQVELFIAYDVCSKKYKGKMPDKIKSDFKNKMHALNKRGI